MALAVSLQVPYDLVSQWEDRIKATHWLLLEQLEDRRDGG